MSVFQGMFAIALPLASSTGGRDRLVHTVGLDDDEAALEDFLRLIFEPPYASEAHRRIFPRLAGTSSRLEAPFDRVWPVCGLAHKYDVSLLTGFGRQMCGMPAKADLW